MLQMAGGGTRIAPLLSRPFKDKKWSKPGVRSKLQARWETWGEDERLSRACPGFASLLSHVVVHFTSSGGCQRSTRTGFIPAAWGGDRVRARGATAGHCVWRTRLIDITHQRAFGGGPLKQVDGGRKQVGRKRGGEEEGKEAKERGGREEAWQEDRLGGLPSPRHAARPSELAKTPRHKSTQEGKRHSPCSHERGLFFARWRERIRKRYSRRRPGFVDSSGGAPRIQ